MKLQKIRRRKQDFTTELKWFDILILTVILFSNAIYTSTIQYISSSNAESFEGATDFSTAQNYSGFRMQLALLLLALLYLWIRNFDFSKWKLRITPQVHFIFCAFIPLHCFADGYFFPCDGFHARWLCVCTFFYYTDRFAEN